MRKLKRNKHLIHNWLSEHRWEIFVFLVASILFLGVFLAMIYFHKEDFMVRSDSPGYIKLAKNLINYKVFSRSANPPLLPDSFRTPLYPLFLAGVFLFSSHLWIVGLIQCFLAALGIVFVFKIGSLLGGKIIGLAGAALFGLDFYHLISTGFVHTEALFVPLFIISIYYFLLFLKKQKKKSLAISALFLGLSALVRPIAFYLVIVLLVIFLFVYIFIWKKKISLSLIKPILIFSCLLFLIVLPWMFRNQILFGKFALSSVKDYNFYFWNLASIQAKNFGVAKKEIQPLLLEKIKQEFLEIKKEEISSFKLADYYKKESKKALKGHYFEYLKEHLSGSLYFLAANYYRKAGYVATGAKEENIPIYDPIQLVKEGKIFERITDLIKKGGFPIIMMIVGFLISGIYLLFLIFNVFYIFRVKNPASEILLYGIIGYFALLTGPLASGSYRYPVLPFIIILALLGFNRIWKSLRHNKQRS